MATKKTTRKKTISGPVNKINVTMYKVGTGDFFLLQFKKDDEVSYNMMIDCGSIKGVKTVFDKPIADIAALTKGKIDLMVVTHEHADHINGFKIAATLFNTHIKVERVWFAWTEAKNKFSNAFRKEHAKIKMAIALATIDLNARIKDKSFEKIYKDEYNEAMMMDATKHFGAALDGLNELNMDASSTSLSSIPTMEDILRGLKIITTNTLVEFFEPGNVIEDIPGLEGIRFFVLGPPKDNDAIKKEEIKGEGYEKRQKKSTLDMAFINRMNANGQEDASLIPFSKEYVLEATNTQAVKASYSSSTNTWRNIDNEWLLNAGALALRHETSINNTSLALAIQFTGSERILLFPGDAEQGSWLSWHNNLEWSFKDKDNKTKKVNAEYILNNTVFYKVSHHDSQNGTPKKNGLEMFKQDELAAMVTLDLDSINTIWMNTMPNDLIGAELIRKTKGKVFFAGDCNKIIKNILTDRVSVTDGHLKTLRKVNGKFANDCFVNHEVTG